MAITHDRVENIDAGESLARARAGDAAAFCRLTEPLQTRLLRQAAALSGDISAAEDLVAETLVEAWKSLARYDEICRFSTWLYAILLHRHQKWRRRARSRPVALAWLPAPEREQFVARQENIPSPEPSPAEDAARNENSMLLRQCVARLPEKHQQIILLRFFEDASLPDMARVLNCPVGTVKSRLLLALEKTTQNKNELSRDERRYTDMNWIWNRCRRRQDVSLLAAGALGEEERADLKQHMAECQKCRSYFSEIKTLTAPLAAWGRDVSVMEATSAARVRWAKAVQDAGAPSAMRHPPLKNICRVAWRELVLPNRNAWTGMAVLWVAMLVINGHLSGHRTGETGTSTAFSQEMIQAWEEQNRVLAELTQPEFVVPAPPPNVPRPRSEREEDWVIL